MSQHLPPIASLPAELGALATTLRSTDDAARIAALADVDEADDELAAEILAVLQSTAAPELRAAAAIALGPTLEVVDADLDEHGRVDASYGEPVLSQRQFDRVTAALEELCRDPAQPELVRRRALEAAVRSPRPWQVPVVRKAWAGDSLPWRMSAVFAMAYLADVDFSAEIVAAFHSGTPELVREAVFAAGQREVVALRHDIAAIADDEQAQRELRLTAVEALGWLADDEATALLERLSRAQDGDLAETAELALAMAQLDLDDEEL